MNGHIHSIETFGTLDGPGIRMIVFLQGCNLRCRFCHNPDTWSCKTSNEISPEKLISKVIRYKPFYKGGGITFSGGEPLLQPEFLKECLILCKKNNIHTAIDTSGVGLGVYDEILKYVDLVILDIKHSLPEKYKYITRHNIDDYHIFKESVIRNNKKLWLKNVVTPTINDTIEDMFILSHEIKSFPNKLVEKMELLPYHTLGVYKYEKLGIDYSLAGVEPLDSNKLKVLKENLAELCIGYNIIK